MKELHGIPEELLLPILSNLNDNDLMIATQVSHKFRRLATEVLCKRSHVRPPAWSDKFLLPLLDTFAAYIETKWICRVNISPELLHGIIKYNLVCRAEILEQDMLYLKLVCKYSTLIHYGFPLVFQLCKLSNKHARAEQLLDEMIAKYNSTPFVSDRKKITKSLINAFKYMSYAQQDKVRGIGIMEYNMEKPNCNIQEDDLLKILNVPKIPFQSHPINSVTYKILESVSPELQEALLTKFVECGQPGLASRYKSLVSFYGEINNGLATRDKIEIFKLVKQKDYIDSTYSFPKELLKREATIFSNQNKSISVSTQDYCIYYSCLSREQQRKSVSYLFDETIYSEDRELPSLSRMMFSPYIILQAKRQQSVLTTKNIVNLSTDDVLPYGNKSTLRKTRTV